MSHSCLVVVQSPQVMTSVSTLMEWTYPRGLPGWVLEVLSLARGQAPMKKTQDGCPAQRGHVMNRRTPRLTVSITTELLEPRCGVLIVRVIFWWLAAVTALSRYYVINVFLVCEQFYLVLFPGWMFARDTIRKIKHWSLVVELWVVDNASRVIICATIPLYSTCTCVFCQIWSVLSGAQVYVSRDGNIGVTKLSFLLGR